MDTVIKTKRQKPSKDTLEFYVSELGWDGAMELFDLTESEANRITFGAKVVRDTNDNIYSIIEKPYMELEEPKSANTKLLKSIIESRYDDLRKLFVKDTEEINVRALSDEDIFHNGLLTVLKYEHPNFKFVDKENSYLYVVKAIRFGIKSEIRENAKQILRNMAYTEYIDVPVQDNEENKYTILRDDEFVNTLTAQQRLVVSYIIDGYSQVDIAKNIQVDKSRVTRIVGEIKLKITSFAINHNMLNNRTVNADIEILLRCKN
jgi:predicted DNA-binding protein YlxM (UPF0122 family)